MVASRRGLVFPLISVAILWLVLIGLHAEAAHPNQDTPAARALPPGLGSDVARARCLACHGPDLVVQQRLSPDGWARELDKMVGWGALVTEAERPILLHYLATHFGPTPQSAEPDSVAGAIVKARCEVCHDRALIDQQRLTPEGWTREIEKMAGWGAVVTDEEKAALVEYLAARRPEP